MKEDPVVQEVREIRKRIDQEKKGDIKALSKLLVEIQKKYHLPARTL